MSAIAVLGPGGVGGLLAAALVRSGRDVIVIARAETARVIAERGLAVHSRRLGDFHARPRAATALGEPVETLLIATKATGLIAALERITVGPPLVVPLLNGLDHLAVLRERFGREHVAAGVIRVESDRPLIGEIVQRSPFLRVDLATEQPALRRCLERFARTLEAAEIPVRLGEREAPVMWSKLVRLCALACTTSASDQTIGVIRSDPAWRARLLACIDEAAAVANAEGAALDPAATVAELDAAHPELGSSMQRDVAAGREPELDAIAGAVLRAGARHRIPCPTIAGLASEIAARAGLHWP